MRDYISDFLTSGESENLKTPQGGKAQKAQKSPGSFENTQARQVSKGSKGTFEPFDTSPSKGFSKNPGLPSPTPTFEICPVCKTALLSEAGRRFTHVLCPRCCFETWRDQEPQPRIVDGDLIIPVSAPAQYHYWADGQSVVETLTQLNAPLETWERYAARLTENHGAICAGAIRQSGKVRYCAECRRFAEVVE